MNEVSRCSKQMLDDNMLKYISENIFPLYERNDKSHGIEHIMEVINRSLEVANEYDVNENIVYVVAAYHDLGHYIDRDTHEIISADIFINDKYIEEWLTSVEICLAKEAILDHRASCKHEPRTIYGKIISTADRTIMDIDNTIIRTYLYGKKHSRGITEEEQVFRVFTHLKDKYGDNGYCKTYLPDDKFDEALDKLRLALNYKEEFIIRIKNVIKSSTCEII